MVFCSYRSKFPTQGAAEQETNGVVEDRQTPFSFVFWSFFHMNQRVGLIWWFGWGGW